MSGGKTHQKGSGPKNVAANSGVQGRSVPASPPPPATPRGPGPQPAPSPIHQQKVLIVADGDGQIQVDLGYGTPLSEKIESRWESDWLSRGRKLILIADPQPGAKFTGWKIAPASAHLAEQLNDPVLQIDLDADYQITANFSAAPQQEESSGASSYAIGLAKRFGTRRKS